MEILDSENIPDAPKKLQFKGSGSDYFAILILNWLLTSITLGLYYPWARARTLSYIYGNTELEGSRFVFHGTGKQMFVGFIKAIILIVCMYSLVFFGGILNSVFNNS